MDAEQEQRERADFVRETMNYQSILRTLAARLRPTRPDLAGMLYVLERDVYDAVSLGLLSAWPESLPAPDVAPQAKKSGAAKPAACRHDYGDGAVCKKCGKAKSAGGRPKKDEAPAEDTRTSPLPFKPNPNADAYADGGMGSSGRAAR